MAFSCGACKFLRRKCGADVCLFAPHFSYQHAEAHFSAIHKVFGASNVSKLLAHLPEHHRAAAAISITYEALARISDPVHGCVGHVIALQQQVISLQEEVESLTTQMICKSSSLAERRPNEIERWTGGTVGSNFQELQAGYREALARLEHCLFSEEEQTSLEESSQLASCEVLEDFLWG